MFVIQITGGRNYFSEEWIYETLKEYVDQYGANNIKLRHGNAKGADILSAQIARGLGITDIEGRPVEYYGYSWNKNGRSAGQLRNEAMLDEKPYPNIVLAFPDPSSKGTWNMVRSATNKGFTVRIIK